MLQRRAGVLVALLAVSLSPSTAAANGVVSHMHISDLAVGHLPAGELRALLSDPELVDIVRAGSVFPDSGYAADDDYGEIAHWEPFTQSYVEWIRASFEPPYDSPEARRHVAFLMGQASHGLADQVFDSLFMARVDQFDGDSSDLDTGAETWLLTEHDPDNQIEPYVDEVALRDVFEGSAYIDYAPTTDQLVYGSERIVQAIDALYAVATFAYEDYWVQMPWGATHYYEADEVPGSLPHIATFVSAYWQALWERLHGRDTLAAHVLGTWPEDGAVNFEVTRERIETRAMVAFGHGIAAETLTDANVRLFGPGDEVVPSSARFIYGSSHANAVLVRPDGDLAYDTEYRIEVGTGLESIDGRALEEPFSFAFRTRCAPDALDECPPLPEPWERPEDPMPPPRDAGTRPRPDAGPADAGVDAGPAHEPDAGAEDGGGGGCSAGGAGGAGGAWLALLAFARRRR